MLDGWLEFKNTKKLGIFIMKEEEGILKGECKLGVIFIDTFRALREDSKRSSPFIRQNKLMRNR